MNDPAELPTVPPTTHTAPSGPGPSGRPAFLTVEEAMRVLRLGRTTAYGLASQWEATNGQTGLPVVRFGRQLRVPLQRLEELAGGPLDLTLASPEREAATEPTAVAGKASPPDGVTVEDGPATELPPAAAPTRPPHRPTPVPAPPASDPRRRPRPPHSGQSSLFGEAS